MQKCPNCGQTTTRTEDWACPWCGHPLLSRSYKKVAKTFRQIKKEVSPKETEDSAKDSEEDQEKKNPPDLEATVSKLQVQLSADVRVAGWPEILPMVKTYVELIQSWNWIWYLVVFVAMGFGIVNTTLMAVFERIREFGLLKSLGMKPWWILRGVLTESFMLLTLGTIIGNILALICIVLLSRGGIDLSALAQGAEYAGMSRVIFPALELKDVLMANAIVMLLGLAVSAYPAIKAARFTPVEALAHT